MANDGCIYYLPNGDVRILKLDPSDGDRFSIVEVLVMSRDGGYTAAVLGNDGYIYGFSWSRIIKFSPTDHSVYYIGSEFEEYPSWVGAVLAEDGNIYSVSSRQLIIQVDTVNIDWKVIDSKKFKGNVSTLGCPVLGSDKCIYMPPLNNDRVVKFNPHTKKFAMIGESYGESSWKWDGAVLAPDGFIFCIPHDFGKILQIDSRHTNEKVVEMIEKLSHE